MRVFHCMWNATTLTDALALLLAGLRLASGDWQALWRIRARRTGVVRHKRCAKLRTVWGDPPRPGQPAIRQACATVSLSCRATSRETLLPASLQASAASRLLFARVCRTVGRGHGR